MRFRVQLPASVRVRTEVPLQAPHDLRAWDAELRTATDACKLEAETTLYDLQTTDRKIALKLAHDDAERVILLVAATKHNRRVLREFRARIHRRDPAIATSGGGRTGATAYTRDHCPAVT